MLKQMYFKPAICYFIFPGLGASVLAGVPGDNAAQAALLAASPSLAYTRLSTPGALSHHGYHPYRR